MTSLNSQNTRERGGARQTHQKRARPYKTELGTVFTKKRKVDVDTIYGSSNRPEGFRFLPLGTADLADQCRKLSEQRSFAYFNVNDDRTHGSSRDRNNVSHYVHRIGYFFHSQIVEQASQQLGYVFHGEKFIKEASIKQPHETSRLWQIMRKHGIRLPETNDQISSAIQELFPKMPDKDLQAIIQHSWEEGSDRVGTNREITLPRRVQLAVVARIRHIYTDYDVLLKAFEWSEARGIVGPQTLEKLKEWRGEDGETRDDELVQELREIILLPGEDEDEEDKGIATGYNPRRNRNEDVRREVDLPRDHGRRDRSPHFPNHRSAELFSGENFLQNPTRHGGHHGRIDLNHGAPDHRSLARSPISQTHNHGPPTSVLPVGLQSDRHGHHFNQVAWKVIHVRADEAERGSSIRRPSPREVIDLTGGPTQRAQRIQDLEMADAQQAHPRSTGQSPPGETDETMTVFQIGAENLHQDMRDEVRSRREGKVWFRPPPGFDPAVDDPWEFGPYGRTHHPHPVPPTPDHPKPQLIEYRHPYETHTLQSQANHPRQQGIFGTYPASLRGEEPIHGGLAPVQQVGIITPNQRPVVNRYDPNPDPYPGQMPWTSGPWPYYHPR